MRFLIRLLVTFLFLIAGPALAALDFPTLSGRVVDDAGILSTKTEQSLATIFAAHEGDTSNQIVVVTLSSLQGTTIEDFGVQLGRHWQIGQEDRNNGVLLIVAPNERKVRIEVGYGLEGDLTDALASSIVQNEILPAFRDGNMEAGVVAGANAIILAIGGAYEPPPKLSIFGDERPPAWAIAIAVLVLIVLVFLFFRFAAKEGLTAYGLGKLALEQSGRRGSRGSFGGGFSGGGGSFGGGGASGGW